MKILRGNKTFLSIFACLALLCLAISLTTTFGIKASADTSSENYSFVTYTQAAAQYLNQLSRPGLSEADKGIYENAGLLDEIDPNTYYGTCGSLLGYLPDASSDRNSIFIYAGTESKNAVTYDYKTVSQIYTGGKASRQSMTAAEILKMILTGKRPSGKDAEPNPGFAEYAYYGRTLNLLGYDETSLSGTSASTRQMIGLITLAAYILSYGLSAFFELIISLLSVANPFRMFSESAALNALDYFNGSMKLNIDGSKITLKSSINSGMNDFIGLVSQVYDTVHSMSMAVILPIFLAVTVFTWLIINKGTGFWRTWKGYFVKLTFVAMGVPLMFMCYQTALDWTAGALNADQINGTQIITSTFCDFESWVDASNLALPSDVELVYDASTDSLDSNTINQTRKFCALINKHAGAESSEGDNKYTDVLIYDEKTDAKQYENYDVLLLDKRDMKATTNKDFSEVISMLQRYSRGDFISASAYESASRKTLGNSVASLAFTQLSSHWDYFDADRVSEAPLYENSGGKVKVSASKARSWALERFSKKTFTYDKQECANFYADADANTATFNASDNKYTYKKSDDGTSGHGLSTLATYNYLSTDFVANHATVYSAVNSSNDKVKMQHYSVNMVGSGVMRIIYWLDALALMMCMALLGYGYGFALLLGNFKAIFKMIPAVITGMWGSMRGIATALALTAAIIVEVLVTFLLYDIACDVIVLIYKIVEIPFAKALRSVGGTSSLFSSTGFAAGFATIATPLLGIVSIVLIVSLTKKLLQWRHAVVQSTIDLCTKTINKFLGTDVASPNIDEANAGNKLMNALSVGTGLAMGASAMGLGDSETFKNLKDQAKDGLTNAKDGILSDEGRESLENAFGVKTGNGTGENENGEVAESTEDKIDSLTGEGVDGEDERGLNTDSAVEDYLAENKESDLFGTGVAASDSKKPDASLSGRKLTKGEAGGVHKAADGTLVDADGNEVVKNADGSYSYAENPELKAGRELTDDEAAGVHEDASGKLVDSSGSSVVKNADGSYSYEDKAGRDLTAEEMSGLKTDADGKLVDAEGNAVVQNSDGSYSYAQHGEDYRGGFVDSEGNAVFKNADGTFSDSDGNAVDAREVRDAAGNSVATNDVGDYNYMKSTGLDDAGAMDAYMDADLADDGQLNHSADAATVEEQFNAQQSARNSRGGGYAKNFGSTSSGVNARPIAGAEYQSQYDNAYADADFADDGEFNGSVAATGRSSDGRKTVQAGKGTMSNNYKNNYSEEYAEADFADDGQYNGSVQVTGTNERGQFTGNSRQASAVYTQTHDTDYMQADLTDDGKFNNSVAGVTNASGQMTVKNPNIASKAYQQNYSGDYANADFADDGKYNGSVAAGGRGADGKYVIRQGATEAYNNSVTGEYAAADFADDGSYNNSVDYITTSSGKRTVNPNQRPSANYKANHDEVYTQADFADDGQYNGSVEGAVEVSTGRTTVNRQVGPSAAYQTNHDVAYTQVDFADDGQYNGSVAGVRTESGKVTVKNPNIASKAYQQNYSGDYAQADFADDGYYNGSVEGVSDSKGVFSIKGSSQSQTGRTVVVPVVTTPGAPAAANNVVYQPVQGVAPVQPNVTVAQGATQTGGTFSGGTNPGYNARPASSGNAGGGYGGGGMSYDYSDGSGDYSYNVHNNSNNYDSQSGSSGSGKNKPTESKTTYTTNNTVTKTTKKQSSNNYANDSGTDEKVYVTNNTINTNEEYYGGAFGNPNSNKSNHVTNNQSTTTKIKTKTETTKVGWEGHSANDVDTTFQTEDYFNMHSKDKNDK